MRRIWVVSLAVLAVGVSTPSVAADAASLIETVKRHDVGAVKAALASGADVNATEPDGSTALHWAAYVDDAPAAELLLKAGANPRAANLHGVTPLSLAAVSGSAPIIEMLLLAGADPNVTHSGGEPVLMTAARTGKVEAVEVLLRHGADVNAKDASRDQTALMWAAAEGHAAVVERLVKAGADIKTRSEGGFTAFLFAARQGKIDAVKALLRAGANVNETTIRPAEFIRAAVPGYALGFRPQGPTPALVLAVGSGHFELASVLLEAGANPNAAPQGWTALHHLTWVRKCGQGDNKPCPPVIGAIDSLDLLRRLVAHGADVNARMTERAPMGTTEVSNIGATPFLLAARTADAELMRELHKHGADPLLANNEGTTPLLAAAGCGTYNPGVDPGTESEALEAVKLAFELGGDVNTVDQRGCSAMHGAAYKFLPTVVKFLAENGARIEIWNRKDKFGFVPLKIAEGMLRSPTAVGDHFRLDEETAAAIREVMQGVPPGTESSVPVAAAPAS
jgi:ankyrin repeat protein